MGWERCVRSLHLSAVERRYARTQAQNSRSTLKKLQGTAASRMCAIVRLRLLVFQLASSHANQPAEAAVLNTRSSQRGGSVLQCRCR